jgi:serpin B
MRVGPGLLLLCLAMAIRREANAVQPAETPLAPGGNQFALELYSQLDRLEPQKNLFFSPESISLALSMTAAGARGETLAEMQKTLHLGENLDQAHAAYHQLLEHWNAAGKPYQLSVANRLWGQKGFAIREAFLELTRRQYEAPMELLDFAQAAAASRAINDWVSQQTHDKIKDLISPEALGADTRLVLTNAIYFLGDWVDPFEKRNTRDQLFKISASQQVTAPLMYQKASFGYAEEKSLQVLEMAYAGRELSMVVILPRDVEGLGQLERELSPARLSALLAEIQPREVMVHLPHFKMETSFELSKALTAMGMGRAFSPQADFSGISETTKLYVSAVLHKAYVDVNERGTEAAAATGVVMKAMAMPIREAIPDFRADHPFLFIIRERQSGAILFLGRVINPLQSGS